MSGSRKKKTIEVLVRKNSQDLIVAQGLPGRAAIPAAVWDFPVGSDNVEGVVDEVVLQDAVIGCAGGQRG